MSFSDDILRAIRRASAPATVSLVIALGVAYVAAWLSKSPVLFDLLAFLPHSPKLWTALTYPFASLGSGDAFIWLLVLLWWLWSMGGSVERDMGTNRYLILFFACTLVGALSMVLASIIQRASAPLAGSLIPIASITIAWGIANPTSQILFMLVIPLQGKWLALITALVVLFALGSGSPVVGVFALLPLALAASVANNRIPFFPYSGALYSRQKSRKIDSVKAKVIEDKVRSRKKEREEKERLRKLFEDSMKDDH